MKLILKLIYVVLGTAIFSMGSTILRVAHLGVDPFTSMNIGLSNLIHLPLGLVQIVTNLIILAYIFFTLRKSIGIGTILNMTLSGIFVQMFTTILTPHFKHLSFIMILICLVGGILLFTFGAALYMKGNLGTAPYDAVVPALMQKIKKPYGSLRKGQDVFTVILAFLFRGPVGIGTIICAFGVGPLIDFWGSKIPTVK